MSKSAILQAMYDNAETTRLAQTLYGGFNMDNMACIIPASTRTVTVETEEVESELLKAYRQVSHLTILALDEAIWDLTNQVTARHPATKKENRCKTFRITKHP